MVDTQRSESVFTKLQRIAKMAKSKPGLAFTSLAHLIDLPFLREAWSKTKRDSAPGIDGMTFNDYAANLDANLQNLYQRLKTGAYIAPPVKRVWIPKEDGTQRPIGMPALEDNTPGKLQERFFRPCIRRKSSSGIGLNP